MPAGSYKKSHKTIPSRLTGFMKASKTRRFGAVQSAREASFVDTISKTVVRRVNAQRGKFYLTENGENVNLYHNGGGTGNVAALASGRCSNLLATNTGDQQNQRTGDSLIGKGIAIKLWLSNKPDRPNVMYRVLVLQYYHGFTPNTSNNIWKSGSSPNLMLADVDTDRFKVRYDRMVYSLKGYSASSAGTLVPNVPSANNYAREQSRYLKLWVKTPGVIKYQLDNGQVPADQKYLLALYVIPYDAYGTLTGDNIASVAWQTCFYWTNH